MGPLLGESRALSPLPRPRGLSAGPPVGREGGLGPGLTTTFFAGALSVQGSAGDLGGPCPHQLAYGALGKAAFVALGPSSPWRAWPPGLYRNPPSSPAAA